MVKICTKCHAEKPLEGFGKKTTGKDGLMAYCKACDAARCKAWREANKEKVAASYKAWREANKEKKAASEKAWQKANPEKVAASYKAWADANKEKIAVQGKAWQDANPYKCLAGYAKARARKCNALPSWYSQKHHDQIIGIYEERANISEETGIQHEVDHILPLNGATVSGFHIPENLQIITKTENLKKGNKHDFS